MKFIQSFWSKPFFDSDSEDDFNKRHFGGFPSAFLFYGAWCYSCLSIHKYYPNLHLVTDDNGQYLLGELLGLPYKSISTNLNDLSRYPTHLWALGKLYTYRLQQVPFCHIDGDVFIFGNVLDQVVSSSMFCQSYETSLRQYAEIHPYVHKNFRSVPAEFDSELNESMKFINAGIIGGANIDLFQQYTKAAFELLDHNLDQVSQINSSLLNLYYEQFLLSNIIDKDDSLVVKYLFCEPDDQRKHDFAAFHGVPHSSQYIHLISHLKRKTIYLEQVMIRLQLEFPNYYNKVIELFNSRHI